MSEADDALIHTKKHIFADMNNEVGAKEYRDGTWHLRLPESGHECTVLTHEWRP